MRTFHLGGIHPKENKLSAGVCIENFPLMDEFVVFTNQHLGSSAIPIVEAGEKVKTGQLIAQADGFISANIHSPVSGVIAKIDEAVYLNGYKRQAIFIKREGDEWLETIDTSTTIKHEILLSQQEIIDKIKAMGIIGLGGACFPAHVKYIIPEEKKLEYLIVNAAECEPYLTSDHRIILERAEELFVGTQILMKALNVTKAIIGIENNKRDAIIQMQQLSQNYNGVEVQVVKVKYPQGAEKQLIKALTKRSVPTGKLPIDVGCVVNNIGTVLAVYEAVQKNKPLIENVLTITGNSLLKQKNYLVRMGTSITALIESVGGLPEDTCKVISGGPLMGKALPTVKTYTVKGTASILILGKEESIRKQELGCIRCAKCVKACPMGLEPYLLALLIKNEKTGAIRKEKIMDCIECGCCSFVCPANIQLVDVIRLGKMNIRNTQIK